MPIEGYTSVSIIVIVRKVFRHCLNAEGNCALADKKANEEAITRLEPDWRKIEVKRSEKECSLYLLQEVQRG